MVDMLPIVMRMGVLALALLVVWVGALLARSYANTRRMAVLSAEGDAGAIERLLPPTQAHAPVRILAFSSADCSPCHTLQAPALQRVREARPGQVDVLDIDAPASPDLTARYAVLTVPSTVVLDAEGRAHAVNYGYANARKLLAQVDALLARDAGGTGPEHETEARLVS